MTIFPLAIFLLDPSEEDAPLQCARGVFLVRVFPVSFFGDQDTKRLNAPVALLSFASGVSLSCGARSVNLPRRGTYTRLVRRKNQIASANNSAHTASFTFNFSAGIRTSPAGQPPF
jgi:hypothetical protein